MAFAKRLRSEGSPSNMQPSSELDSNLSDGVVAEKEFIEELETNAQHSQEVLDEDDAFLGSASPEVWEYEVVDARAAEFEEALRNSGLILEYDIVDSTATGAEEATAVALDEGGVYPPDGGNEAEDVTSSGSGVRAGDDGPGGMPTGDPSAGGLDSGPRHHLGNEVEGLGEEGSGGIDDLNVMKAGDPRLGLTNRGEKPPEDWAADTGKTRNPDRGVESDNLLDDASTLGPDKLRSRR